MRCMRKFGRFTRTASGRCGRTSSELRLARREMRGCPPSEGRKEKCVFRGKRRRAGDVNLQVMECTRFLSIWVRLLEIASSLLRT